MDSIEAGAAVAVRAVVRGGQRGSGRSEVLLTAQIVSGSAKQCSAALLRGAGCGSARRATLVFVSVSFASQSPGVGQCLH